MTIYNARHFKYFIYFILILCAGCNSGSGSRSNNQVAPDLEPVPSTDTSIEPIPDTDTSIEPIPDTDTSIEPIPDTDTSIEPIPSTDMSKFMPDTSKSKVLPDTDSSKKKPSPNIPLGKIPAFPGAGGFGAYATGGRGGKVIKVTNLNASGTGSLQDALNQKEPRIIIFEVSGVITADIIRIPHGDVTIAGQTAPGAGITIEGRLYGAYSYNVKNIIIRHIKIRPPVFNHQSKGNQFDAVQLSRNSNIILDHVSMSFGVDETLDLYSAKDVTVQWSTIEQSSLSGHPEANHNYGMINGPQGGRISVLNNLFAHFNKRAPALSVGPAETINNVMYNIKDNWLHHNPAKGPFLVSNNYFKRGPSSSMTPIFLDAESVGSELGYYFDSNYVDDPAHFQGVLDPFSTASVHPSLRYVCTYFKGPDCKTFKLKNKPDFTSHSTYLAPVETDYRSAYDNVLKSSGAFPRDVVTLTSVQEVKARTGAWGARIPANLLKGLQVKMAPLDTDNDGMSDEWENNNGLDSTDASDQHSIMSTGYPAIEQYINEMADDLLQ